MTFGLLITDSITITYAVLVNDTYYGLTVMLVLVFKAE